MGRAFDFFSAPRSRKGLNSGPETGSIYRLAGRNRYKDGEGNVFVIDAEFQAVWNGVKHRYSWLE